MARLLQQRPAPSLWQRVKLWAGRRRLIPQRETIPYARQRQVGAWNNGNGRPTLKPVPSNLRYFSRTVYASRAIAFYTQSISLLDWHFQPREGVKDSPEIKRQIEIATNCLLSPNIDDSAVSFISQVIEDVCVGGAGAYEKQIGGEQMRPIWLWPVDALSIQIYADWDGDESRPRYCQSLGYGNIGTTQGVNLLNRELVYLRDRPTTDNPFSFGMLEVAFESINRLLGVNDYAGNLASNAHPENMIWLKDAGQDEIEAFRAFWRNEVEAQGQVPVIGNEEADVLKLRGSNDEALYPQYKQFIIREIATAFNLSPQNLGVEADVNRNTSEVAEDRDWNAAIKPRAWMFARYFNREVLQSGMGWHQIELVPGGLDREDEKATAEIFDLEYKNNAITANEYRARRNRPPLEGPWGDMVKADVDIAIQAARGAGVVDDPDLPKSNAAPAGAKKKGNK